MAIWQYKLYVIPEEELKSYFNNVDNISIEAFDNIVWWKYRPYKSINFNSLKLPFRESWSKDIKQLGDISSDCIETFVLEEKIIEISIRIDLRKNYKVMVEYICEFAQDNGFCFLNDKLKLISSAPQVINQDIRNHKIFEEFTNKLDK